MIALAVSSPTWAHWAAGLAIDVALKATVVCLLAYAVHFALGRRRVLVRSVLWNGCVAGLLVLPFGVLWFPNLQIACLPPVRPRTTAPPIAAGEQTVARSASVPSEKMHAIPPPPFVISPVRVFPEPERLASAPRSPGASAMDPFLVGLGVYSTVALGLALRLAMSICAVGRLRRSTRPIEDQAWREALDRWRSRISIRCRVTLACSARTSVPLVIGWLRPMIVVPERLVATVSPGSIDAILLHELAHVRRGDYPWNLLLRLVQIVYWPHPLAWLIGRTVVAVREQACDDLCVYLMEDAMSYRTILLDVAAGLVTRPREALGLGMARSSRLGRRIKDIESSNGTARCLLQRPVRLLIVAIVIAAASVVGSVRLARTAAAQAAQPARKNVAAAKDETKAAADTKATHTAKPEVIAPADVQKENEKSPFKFEVAKVRRGNFKIQTTQSATLEIAETADLFPPASGGVLGEVMAGVGEVVKKGQVLARVDRLPQASQRVRAELVARQAKSKQDQARAEIAVAQANLEGAEAKVTQAKTELDEAGAAVESRKKQEDRVMNLRKQTVVGEQAVDAASDARRTAEAALAGAEARLRLAKSEVGKARAEVEGAKAGFAAAVDAHKMASFDLDRTDSPAHVDIVAPFDGIVTQRDASVGSLVRINGEGRPLFVVSRTDTIRVVSSVSQADAFLVDPGDPVTFRLKGAPSQSIQSTVSRVDYKLDLRSHKLRVECVIPNSTRKLLPGMDGELTILLEERRNVLQVPWMAVYYANNDIYRCIRIEGGKAFPANVGVDGGSQLHLDIKAFPDEAARLHPSGVGIAYVEITRGLKEGDSVLAIVKRVEGEGNVPSLAYVLFDPGQTIDTIRLPEGGGIQ